jgi:uncharacterized damage-inducible protein DinB
MLTQLRELFAYNRWANERMLDACSKLSAEHVTREIGGSFPSVWLTLTHMYGAENSWLVRWQGRPEGQRPDLSDTNDVAGLRAKWNDLWERQSAFLNATTDADVRRIIPIHLFSGKKFEQQLAGTMRHCINHSTYHRGQITNFLRMLGAETVGLDLVLYYMEHPPAD